MGNGISTCLIGHTSSNGPFSIAMLDYRSVAYGIEKPWSRTPSKGLQWFLFSELKACQPPHEVKDRGQKCWAIFYMLGHLPSNMLTWSILPKKCGNVILHLSLIQIDQIDSWIYLCLDFHSRKIDGFTRQHKNKRNCTTPPFLKSSRNESTLHSLPALATQSNSPDSFSCFVCLNSKLLLMDKKPAPAWIHVCFRFIS